MNIAISDDKDQLTDLVPRAEAGDEIILTRHAHPAVRLVSIKAVPERTSRRAVLEAARAAGIAKATAGPGAARSQDDLYDGDGLPG